MYTSLDTDKDCVTCYKTDPSSRQGGRLMSKPQLP